jgi:putative addiction module component (TIGR02574 family)
MVDASRLERVTHLSRADKQELVDAIGQSVDGGRPVAADEAAFLDQRLAEYRSNRDAGKSLDAILDDLARRRP